MVDFAALAAEFPRASVSWRPQGKPTANGSILALAYIDARDVMDRLDAVCGPAGWQDSYAETPKGRVVCTISIKVGEEWIHKADGAGDTAVEGEKGGISDSFKRAAVKWGIGRYLYAIESPWVPCEVGNNGQFRKFSDDPWTKVRTARRPAGNLATDSAAVKPLSERAAPSGPRTEHEPTSLELFIGKMDKARDLADLQSIWNAHPADLRANPGALKAKDRMKGKLAQQPLEHDGRAA